jgi:acetyltransferase-like isoleucine patch superfamily enzyme
MFALYTLHVYRRAVRRMREFGLRCVLGHVGEDLHVWGRVRVDYPGRVYIGDHCALNEGILILARDDVRMGNGVILSANVMVISASLDYAHSPPPYKRASAPVVIGDYVWGRGEDFARSDDWRRRGDRGGIGCDA